MKKKLIIFDMDGTLVNSSLTIANAINYVRKHLGFEPMEQEYILRRVNDETINPSQIFYHAPAFDKDHERWFSEYYSRYHEEELVLYKGIKELLEMLKSKDCALAVATNAYRRSALESLGHLEVLSLFDVVICADDVKEAKPHAEMLYKILNSLQISKENALFIGDGPRDEIASQRANIDYMMVDWGFSDHRDAIRTVKELNKQIKSII